MPFVVSSLLPDPSLSGLMPGSPLVADLARMFRELGVQFLRASVVRMSSMAFQAAWSISDHGEVTDGPADRGLDSVFPGASQTIGQLAQAASDATLVQKLSPRQWAYGWRLDEDHALICEVHYRERRDTVGDIDSAMVRLVCSASLRGSLSAVPVETEHATTLGQDAVVRRKRPRPAWSRALALMLAVAAALLAAWLWVAPLPALQQVLAAQQAELDRMNTAADGALVHGLAVALATGDYGEVQTELSQFHALGYFGAAAVVNDRGRVVATEGPIYGVRIGEPLVLPLPGTPRTLPLVLASQPYGQLVVLPAPAAARTQVAGDRAAEGAAALDQLRAAAAALALVCAAAALLLAWRPRRPWRAG